MAFDPDAFLASSETSGGFDPDKFLNEDKDQESLLQKAGHVGMGALETVNAPFQVAGEAIRGASESEPLQMATAENPKGFRAPSIVQRLIPSLQTPEPPADPFQKAYQGLEGIVNLPRGIQAASDVVTGQPDLAADIGGMGLALGVSAPKAGKLAIAEEKPAIPEIPKATPIKEPGIPTEPPISGGPGIPPSGAAGKPPLPGIPPEGTDEFMDYMANKYGRAQETPGITQNLGRMLEQKGRGMRLKEIGASPGQIRQLKTRFGEEKVNDLSDLAKDKGISKGFFNFQTGDAIKNLAKTSGQQLEGIRDIATSRGAVHDKGALINQIRAELDPVYMQGTGSAQKGAYLKALQDIQNSPPDVASMAKTITNTNDFIAKNKLTLPLSATRKVMQTATRLNNELAGQYLNPQEMALYEENLKNFSAAKVFDKMYGFTYGRDMAGRTGPGSVWNTIKDIGGRKVLEKVYSNLGRTMQGSKNLPPFKTLSSDVLDSIDQALDEAIEEMGSQPEHKAFGGIVGEMGQYLTPKYGARQ